MMSNGTVLITGATGTIGSELLTNMAGGALTVFAGSTAGAAVDGIAGRKVDFTDVDQLTQAFAGIDTLFLLFPLVPNKIQMAANAVKAAVAAGVGHIVRSSAAGADVASPTAIGRLQGHIDALIIDSGLPYTIVRPASFMQNFANYYAGMIKAGTVHLPHGNGKVSYIDARDIAEVIGVILRKPQLHANKIYTVTGPQALDGTEIVDIIAQEIGKPVTYAPITDEVAAQSMRQSGMSDWNIDIMTSLNRVLAAGYASAITEDVAALTGRQARSFATFAHDYAAAWQ